MYVRTASPHVRWDPDLVAKAVEVVERERFVHAKKLASRLGLSTKKAGELLSYLRRIGLIDLWIDRKGRRKVYCSRSIKLLASMEPSQEPIL